MGEAVHEAKFYFAPLNARADTDRHGWWKCRLRRSSYLPTAWAGSLATRSC
jgi:hypothetical protein